MCGAFVSPLTVKARKAFDDVNSLVPKKTHVLEWSRFQSIPSTRSEPKITYSVSCRHSLSRRYALIVAFGTGLSALTPASRSRAQTPMRTVFDEERELNEKARKEAEETRLAALRAGFDAVQKAIAQLDDLQSLIEEGDWDGVRQFSRLFNDAVEREGMEAVARKLRKKEGRKDALAVSKQVTKALIELDRCAREKNRDDALVYLQQARNNVLKFDSFKP